MSVMWLGGIVVGVFNLQLEIVGAVPSCSIFECDLGRVFHKHLLSVKQCHLKTA